MSLVNADGREWSVNQQVFADDTARVTDSNWRLKQLVEEFGRMCKRRILIVNAGKSKVM